jgi:hypothetical protein
MKKVFLITTAVLVLATVFSFVSCKKEGVYKPKEKISKIYYEYSRKYYSNGTLVDSYLSGKSLSERWHWKGKKLMQVETGNDWPYNFVYKGNQLEKIECGEIEATFIYNKSLYEKIEVKEQDQNILVITVDQRDGNDNITRFFFDIYYDNEGWEIMFKNRKGNDNIQSISAIEPILKMFLPDYFINSLAKNAVKKRQKAIVSERCTVELIYDKNNVVEQKIIYPEDDDSETYIFTYDNKKNPYYKSIHTSIEGIEEGTFIQSENNIFTMYDKDYPEDVTKYEYEYDNDFPVKRVEKYISEWGSYYYEYTYIYYYEYE